MMSKSKLYCYVLLIMLFSGCASGTAFQAETDSFQGKTLSLHHKTNSFQEDINLNPDEEVLVYVYRPGKLNRNGSSVKVTVNKELLGPLNHGNYIATQVPAGKVRVFISGGGLRMSSGVLHINVKAEPDSKLFFKLSSNRKFHWSSQENVLSLDQVTEAVATEEMSTLKRSD